MKAFDYLYYRVYCFYNKQGSDVIEAYASGIVSLVQFMTLVSLIFVINLIYYFELPSKWLFAPVLVLLMVINWYRYERNFDFDKLRGKWKNEDISQRKIKGWLIFFYSGAVILTPVIIGILRHNLEVIN